MAQIVIPSDITLRVDGPISGASLIPGADTVKNSMIGEVLTYDNLQQRRDIIYAQANAHATTRPTAADANQVVYEVTGATGLLLSIKAGSCVKAVGDSTVSIDVKKNGTTVLTAPIVLDNANTNLVSEAGTLVATPTLAAGDVLEVYVDATVGTGTLPLGLWVKITLKEDPQ